uniref:G-protein coupled receptors family 1 profile domain-containing protein n=1 Tax=Haemonchus contortus TaxID=6289 RepID=A0A912N817_HAECO
MARPCKWKKMEAAIATDDPSYGSDYEYDGEDVSSSLIRGFWICHTIVAATAFLLNLVMLFLLLRSTLLKKPFYSLMLVFNVVAVIIQTIIILDVIVSHASSGDHTVYLIRVLSNCFEYVS